MGCVMHHRFDRETAALPCWEGKQEAMHKAHFIHSKMQLVCASVPIAALQLGCKLRHTSQNLLQQARDYSPGLPCLVLF